MKRPPPTPFFFLVFVLATLGCHHGRKTYFFHIHTSALPTPITATVQRRRSFCDLRMNKMLKEHYSHKSSPFNQNSEWVLGGFFGGGKEKKSILA